MEPRLIVETNTGTKHQWHVVDQRGVEPELLGKLNLVVEIADVLVASLAVVRVEMPFDPLEFTIESFMANNVFNLSDSREPGIPYAWAWFFPNARANWSTSRR